MERKCTRAETLYREQPTETCLPPVVAAILKDQEAAKAEPALTLEWLKKAADTSSYHDEWKELGFTEDRVEMLRRATMVFFEHLNRKLRERDIPEFDLEDPDEDITIDLEGEEVTVQWREYYCGDSEYFTKSMPFSDLVDDEQEAA